MKQNTNLLRLSAAAIAVLIATPAWGQAYDPQIAFTSSSGKTTSLYLANEDGSRAVRVATSENIVGIDFAPNDHRIAFTDLNGLKVVSYTPLTTGIRVDSIRTLANGRFSAPDFSGDGSRLLYYQSASPAGYWAIPSAGGAPVLLLQAGSSLGHVRWLQADLGNAFAFLKAVPHGPNVPADYEIWTALLDEKDQVQSVGPSVSTTNQAFKNIQDFDIAHTRTAVLMMVGYPVDQPNSNNLVEFDLVSSAVIPKTVLGMSPHYSDDDLRIVHRNLNYSGTRDRILSFDVTTGVTTTIYTSKQRLGRIDAKP